MQLNVAVLPSFVSLRLLLCFAFFILIYRPLPLFSSLVSISTTFSPFLPPSPLACYVLTLSAAVSSSQYLILPFPSLSVCLRVCIKLLHPRRRFIP